MKKWKELVLMWLFVMLGHKYKQLRKNVLTVTWPQNQGQIHKLVRMNFWTDQYTHIHKCKTPLHSIEYIMLPCKERRFWQSRWPALPCQAEWPGWGRRSLCLVLASTDHTSPKREEGRSCERCGAVCMDIHTVSDRRRKRELTLVHVHVYRGKKKEKKGKSCSRSLREFAKIRQ